MPPRKAGGKDPAQQSDAASAAPSGGGAQSQSTDRDEALNAAGRAGFAGEHPEFQATQQAARERFGEAVAQYPNVSRKPFPERSLEERRITRYSVADLGVLAPSPLAACEAMSQVAGKRIADALERDPSLDEGKIRCSARTLTVVDAYYDKFTQWWQEGRGHRSMLPVKVRLQEPFGDLPEDVQRSVNEAAASVGAPEFKPKDSIILDMKMSISDIPSMEVDYRRSANRQTAREYVRADFAINNVDEKAAYDFVAEPDADGKLLTPTGFALVSHFVGREAAQADFMAALKDPKVPSLKELLDDRANPSGKHPQKVHDMAMTEAMGRKCASMANVDFLSRMRVSYKEIRRVLANAAGVGQGQAADNAPRGKVQVNGDGGLAQRDNALLADVGIMNGSAVFQVYSRNAVNQDYCRQQVLAKEARERDSGRGSARGNY